MDFILNFRLIEYLNENNQTKYFLWNELMLR